MIFCPRKLKYFLPNKDLQTKRIFHFSDCSIFQETTNTIFDEKIKIRKKHKSLKEDKTKSSRIASMLAGGDQSLMFCRQQVCLTDCWAGTVCRQPEIGSQHSNYTRWPSFQNQLAWTRILSSGFSENNLTVTTPHRSAGRSCCNMIPPCLEQKELLVIQSNLSRLQLEFWAAIHRAKWITMSGHVARNAPWYIFPDWDYIIYGIFNSLLMMTDEPGEYANIPRITQSVTFKTFGSQNTAGAPPRWKDWFEHLQIDDSFPVHLGCGILSDLVIIISTFFREYPGTLGIFSLRQRRLPPILVPHPPTLPPTWVGFSLDQPADWFLRGYI